MGRKTEGRRNSQLDNTLAVEGRVARRQSLGGVVGQEVEVELVVGKFELLDQAHAQELVELDCAVRYVDGRQSPALLADSGDLEGVGA